MKKLFWISIIIAVLASFFASTYPDGLDFVAEKLGFAEKGVERSAPMSGYSLKFLPEGGLSTALAGTAGILITLAIFWITAYLLKRGGDKMEKAKVFAFLICVSYFSFFISNFSPAFAARPLVTDDFGTVDPGKFELEIGYCAKTPRSGGDATTGLGVQLKRGFTSNFDFGVEVPYSLTTPTGLNDAVLLAKLKLLEQGENDGLTAKVDIKLANADANSGLGSGYNDYTATLVFSKSFGDLITHYNLGYTWVGVAPGAPEANILNYSAAVEKEMRKGTDLVVEYCVTSASGGSSNNLLVGGRWQVSDLIRIDVGYSLALNDNSSNIVTLGLTAEF